jgi:O-acetyl-ADP-ribose deacetylase (regulator of RNase III)
LRNDGIRGIRANRGRVREIACADICRVSENGIIASCNITSAGNSSEKYIVAAGRVAVSRLRADKCIGKTGSVAKTG